MIDGSLKIVTDQRQKAKSYSAEQGQESALLDFILIIEATSLTILIELYDPQGGITKD